MAIKEERRCQLRRRREGEGMGLLRRSEVVSDSLGVDVISAGSSQWSERSRAHIVR